MLITIAELPEFIKNAKQLLSEDERENLIKFLAGHPSAGKIMKGTGGVRKLRWARKGMGKRSGARVIYYFYDETIPLFLLTIFGKNEKDNLSKAERNELSGLSKKIVDSYKRRPK